jgi:GNAT superfamily N-acetyltransferase
MLVMSTILVRVGGGADIDPARRILRAAYAEYERSFPAANWAPYLEDILDLEGRADESQLLVAEREGDLVGCVSYFPPGSKASYPSDSFSERWPDDWGAFRLLAVDPQARGGGVGRRLTDECIDRARRDGAIALGLHTTAPMTVARAMYERMGFERVAQYDFRPGPTVLVEAYRMLL